jgi:mRNA interferase RelE/StbE
MENYKILIKKSAAAELAGGIPKKDLEKIVRKIRNLEVEPRPSGCRKLSGQDRYRLRQGDYRIVYMVKGRAFSSPLARGFYPRASTAEVDPRAKPGAPARGSNPLAGTAETDPQAKPGAPTAAPAAVDDTGRIVEVYKIGNRREIYTKPGGI